MSVAALDVTAVRARFSALDRPTAFLDGPGGTQVPDSVAAAVAETLKEASDALGEDLGRLIKEGPKEALALTTNEAERRFLERRLQRSG